MFDRWSTGEKAIGIGVATISLIGGIGAPFLILGELRSDVRLMRDKTIPELQKQLDELQKPRPKVALGDACVELIRGYNNASPDSFNGKERQERYEKQMQMMGCNSLTAAYMQKKVDPNATPGDAD